MRKIPEAPPFKKKDTGYAEVTRQYTLITPLFGGGVVAGENDVDMLIRGSSIRGVLRFWWRATSGGKFATLKELRDAEDRIWGAPAERAKDIIQEHGSAAYKPVQISVQVTNKGCETNKNYPPDYISFPLRDEDKKETDEEMYAKLRSDVQFTLTLTYNKDYQPDILAALWAWENFGGIGARTRRGFGAICQTKLLANQKNMSLDKYEELLEDGIEKYLLDGDSKSIKWPNGLPYIDKNLVCIVCKKTGKKDSAWHSVVDKYKDFRKGALTRTFSIKWSESKHVRFLFNVATPNKRNRGSQNNVTPPIDKPLKFPRAQFGLPINYKLEHEKDETVSLEGNKKEHSRLASPLIIRPINNNLCLIIRLNTKGDIVPLKHLTFTPDPKKSGYSLSAYVKDKEIINLSDSDPIKAFFEILKK